MFCTSSDEENWLLDAVLSRQELSSPGAIKYRHSRGWDESILCELHTHRTGWLLLSLLQPTKGFLGNPLNVFIIINNHCPPQLLISKISNREKLGSTMNILIAFKY